MEASDRQHDDELDTDPAVKFLYRTMRERGPGKRKVKPVAKHLIQSDFGNLGDSSDSDFEANEDDADEVVADVKDFHTAEESEVSAEKGIDDAENDEEEESVVGEDDDNNERQDNDEERDDDDDDVDDDDDNDDDDDDDDDDSIEDDGDQDDSFSGDESDIENDENIEDEGESESDEDDENAGLLLSLAAALDAADSENDEDYVPPTKKTKTDNGAKEKKMSDAKENICETDVYLDDNRPRKEEIKISGEACAAAAAAAATGEDGNKLQILVCSVCLGDISAESDEIVECDSCGVSVHEGCYGISDSSSVASTVSSASTEPWFCDACKAGVKNPHCELCPNFGGIYKETDAGKWVHIVCALYIPGVAFGDVDKLSPVTLFEMSYSKWGNKECILCEDHYFSRTGVCIGCDAGMCRSYFHVTCAQREGLLSEASPDEDIADPFYAYCKQHADKFMLKAKRRNFLAFQSQVKDKLKSQAEDITEQARFQRKLARHRRKYNEYRYKRPPCWVPTEKMPRLLSSCPSAVRALLKKAELMGINTQVEHSTAKEMHTRKRYHVSPAFNVEYITYFIERDNRIKSLKKHVTDIVPQNAKLREQETELRRRYDEINTFVTGLQTINKNLKDEGESLWKYLSTAAGKKFPLPEILSPKMSPLKVSTSPTVANKKEFPISPPAGVVLRHCGICNRTRDQHLMAKCDQCNKFYHLRCLDPPLTRMPKKTRLCGWQCSECAPRSSEESDDPDVDTEAPRKLREKIKEPLKFTQFEGPVSRMRDFPPTYGVLASLMKTNLRDIKRGKRRKKKDNSDTKLLQQKKVKQSKHISIIKSQNIFSMECATCLIVGTNSTVVRCDECTLCYHFECLDPPLKKTPKRRGYSWHCAACDPTQLESDFYESDDDTSADPNVRFKIKNRSRNSGNRRADDDDDERDDNGDVKNKASKPTSSKSAMPTKCTAKPLKSSRMQTPKKASLSSKTVAPVKKTTPINLMKRIPKPKTPS